MPTFKYYYVMDCGIHLVHICDHVLVVYVPCHVCLSCNFYGRYMLLNAVIHIILLNRAFNRKHHSLTNHPNPTKLILS